MFRARASNLTLNDLQRLVDDQVQESDEIEFKSTLPSRKGKNDPWQQGMNEIADYPRNEIIAELIAFANAYGGWLLLGVQESDDKPPRAANLSPVRACHELASRFRSMCRDCIEPQLPVLDVAGVATNDDGDGIVAFYVPRSRSGPHRHRNTLHCYVRRADRCEKMSMREVQDLTLNLERGLGAVRRNLKKRRKSFEARLKEVSDKAGEGQGHYGIRVTAIPLSPVHIERVHNVDVVRPTPIEFDAKVTSPLKLILPTTGRYPLDWRPILRGTRGSFDGNTFGMAVELTQDGLVENTLINTNHGCPFFPTWFMCLVANNFCGVERFRRFVGAPSLEYAVEVEILPRNAGVGEGSIGIANYDGHYGVGHSHLGELPNNRILLTDYSLGPPEEFSELAAIIEKDFWNSGNLDWDTGIEVDFRSALEQMGLGYSGSTGSV